MQEVPSANADALSSLRFSVKTIERREAQERPISDWKPLSGLFTHRAPLDRGGLLLQKAALLTIYQHIHWGKNTSENANEQGGLLLGLPYVDPESRQPYSLAAAAVPARNAQGGPAHLHFSKSTWFQMIEICIGQYPEYEVIGWYHTHPGSLGIFMSGTDRSTQDRIFREAWHYALVLNPQKQEGGVFQGRYAKESVGYVCEN